MNRKTVITTLITFALSASSALACTSADVEARQGAFLEAMQVLVQSDQPKALEIYQEYEAGLNTLTETGEGETVCQLIDRLTAEARESS